MPFEQNGIRYYSKSETASAIGVSRQTLYRWIQDRKIPSPRFERKRDGRLFYSESEFKLIEVFTNGIEQLHETRECQLLAFPSKSTGDTP